MPGFRRRRSAYRVLPLVLVSCLVFLAPGCEDDDDDLVSRFGDDESHRSGQDCQQCHREGGSGEGVVTVAGTVYRAAGGTPLPGALVEIRDAEGAAVVVELQVDARGNFYTTRAVNWGEGRTIVVRDEQNSATKPFLLDVGDCNRCHDSGQRIVLGPTG